MKMFQKPSSIISSFIRRIPLTFFHFFPTCLHHLLDVKFYHANRWDIHSQSPLQGSTCSCCGTRRDFELAVSPDFWRTIVQFVRGNRCQLALQLQSGERLIWQSYVNWDNASTYLVLDRFWVASMLHKLPLCWLNSTKKEHKLTSLLYQRRISTDWESLKLVLTTHDHDYNHFIKRFSKYKLIQKWTLPCYHQTCTLIGMQGLQNENKFLDEPELHKADGWIVLFLKLPAWNLSLFQRKFLFCYGREVHIWRLMRALNISNNKSRQPQSRNSVAVSKFHLNNRLTFLLMWKNQV